jgi:hypothetical protein
LPDEKIIADFYLKWPECNVEAGKKLGLSGIPSSTGQAKAIIPLLLRSHDVLNIVVHTPIADCRRLLKLHPKPDVRKVQLEEYGLLTEPAIIYMEQLGVKTIRMGVGSEESEWSVRRRVGLHLASIL